MTFHRTRSGWLALALLFVLLLWDASGLDMALARWAGGPQGFPLRDHWLLTRVLHDAAKALAWAFTLLLCLGVAWPRGPLQALPLARRLQLPATALLASLVVSLLKGASATSCPWDMAEFGGVAQHLSHWIGWSVNDGGGGHCFPAGHATTGFAFVGGFFALRSHQPRLTRVWLLLALVAGFMLGAVQQLRGAHFMSHTLWTAWICWVVGWLADPLFAGPATRQALPTT
jgi:membrane-associated PAP2 superfamily phosphatase